MDLIKLANVAIKAALAAGKIIRESSSERIDVDSKDAGSSYASQVITDVDRACESVILSHLDRSREELDIALLSEEREDNGSRFEKDYFWCVDPMDGTLAFINGYPGFAVSIALVSKEGIPQIGVVYDPSTDIVYHAIITRGAYK
jgi:fructose-1,6-bisphosphatase/inositol monophosphatase family enzyme